MHTAVFSIISPNYRHFARVLMASAARHHPEWDRFVLLVGGDAAPVDDEAFTTIALDALPLPRRRQFSFRYSLLALAMFRARPASANQRDSASARAKRRNCRAR
jgi:hypothetical protein